MRKVHKEEPRVKNIEKQATAKLREAGYLSLIREGNFNFNLMCITNERGYLITARKSLKFRDLNRMIHCIRCYSLVRRKNFLAHMKVCPHREKGPCTMQQANLGLQKL
jgi:hypothetical protein